VISTIPTLTQLCLAACVIGLAADRVLSREEPQPTIKVYADSDFRRYTHSMATYSIEHPIDWEAHEQPMRTNIGSQSGLVPGERGGLRTVYGVIVAIVDDPANAPNNPSLEETTGAVVATILKRNPHQSLREPAAPDGLLAGSPAYRAVLFGTSPVTGRGERAEILCRRIDQKRLLYIIFVSPEENYQQLKPTFVRMRNSLAVPAGR
jgi:hypothetical protein